jgi:hypothetical protein
MKFIPFITLGLLAACGGGSGDTPGDQVPTDCAEQIMTRACAPGATVNKCVTCSGLSGCHGKDSPAITGLDLSLDGLAANEHGKTLINKPADDVNGLCGAAAMPTPIKGKVIIDPNNPENSLMYQKVQTNFAECGSRMPYTASKPLSAADQQCILDWIKKIPGVKSGGANTGDGGP